VVDVEVLGDAGAHLVEVAPTPGSARQASVTL
jgi:hypothetical protein